MFAVVKSIATILSLTILIDRLGRRKLLLTSSIGTALTLWYIGAFVEVAKIDLSKPQSKSAGGWVAIVCVYLYAVCTVQSSATFFPSFKALFFVEQVIVYDNRLLAMVADDAFLWCI